MNIIDDKSAISLCHGGPATTCFRIFTIDGCDNMGFSFAILPGYKEVWNAFYLSLQEKEKMYKENITNY